MTVTSPLGCTRGSAPTVRAAGSETVTSPLQVAPRSSAQRSSVGAVPAVHVRPPSCEVAKPGSTEAPLVSNRPCWKTATTVEGSFGSSATEGSTWVSASEPAAPANGSELICWTKVFDRKTSTLWASAWPARTTTRTLAAVLRWVTKAGDTRPADNHRQAVDGQDLASAPWNRGNPRIEDGTLGNLQSALESTETQIPPCDSPASWPPWPSSSPSPP